MTTQEIKLAMKMVHRSKKSATTTEESLMLEKAVKEIRKLRKALGDAMHDAFQNEDFEAMDRIAETLGIKEEVDKKWDEVMKRSGIKCD